MLCVSVWIIWWISTTNLPFSRIASWLISRPKTSRVLEKRIGSYWAHEIIWLSIIFISVHYLSSITKNSRVWSCHSLLTFTIEPSALSISCTHERILIDFVIFLLRLKASFIHFQLVLRNSNLSKLLKFKNKN